MILSKHLSLLLVLFLEMDEVECLVLEEDRLQISKPPAEVLNAWVQQAVQPG